MDARDYGRHGEMKMVMHMIYEFQKGVRSLVLCTLCPTCARLVIARLEKQGIEYVSQQVSDSKINLFFGKNNCLEAVRMFVHKPLNLLTPEEDYMLGTMLGYDITMQCKRYCERKAKTGTQGMLVN